MRNDAPEPITELRIDELWSFARRDEVVELGLPLPRGRVRDAGELCLVREADELPLQARVLSRWHGDGSLRWVLLRFQTDLDLRRPATLCLCRRPPRRPPPLEGVRVEERPEGLHVATGCLDCRVPLRGAPCLEGFQASFARGSFSGLRLSLVVEDRQLGLLEGRVSAVRATDRGPLAAEVQANAELCSPAGDVLLDAALRLRFRRGKSAFTATLALVSREKDVRLGRVSVRLAGLAEAATEVRAFGGRKGGERAIEYDETTQGTPFTTYHEDCVEPGWVACRTPQGVLYGCIRKARLRFPKALRADGDGIVWDVWPAGGLPYHLYPWMAVTNELLVGLAAPETANYELAQEAALFERPVRPVLPAAYYAACEALGDIFPRSDRYQLFEGQLARALIRRPRGTGQRHAGDEPNLDYTHSGRGKGGMLFTNGEYDTPHLLFVQYARTGARHWFEMAELAARHWLDVDWLRDDANPRYRGGLACHEVDHRARPAAGPSHEWVGGFLDFYHLTGEDEALQAARSVGDNVARYLEDGVFSRTGTYQMRELGWGLVALAALYDETRDERYAQAGRIAVRHIEEWIAAFGGLVEVQRFVDDAKNPDEPLMPMACNRDSFHAITLNGLRRFADATGDSTAERLFLEQVAEQRAWFNGPHGWAEQRETRYPMLEAFAHAWRRTGDAAYLRAGMRILEFGLFNGELRFDEYTESVNTQIQGHPVSYRTLRYEPINAQILGLAVLPMLSFLQAAEEAGLLAGKLDWMQGNGPEQPDGSE